MKGWFHRIGKRRAESQAKFRENLRTVYGRFRLLLQSREKALYCWQQGDPRFFQDLAGHLQLLLETLHQISGPCSLDLVGLFQTLQDRLREAGARSDGTLCFLFDAERRWEGAGPFPDRPIASLSDLLNYVHELAVEAMFDILDRYDPSWSKAPKVLTGLPINLHVIDLGGGLFPDPGKKTVRREEILSDPLRALFQGMYYPGISWSGPIGVNLKGLMVIMAQSTSRPEEDFWDKTYALLTGEYMNYNSRLGYHYNSVDAYLGDDPEKNHIRFMFRGGAADEVRRNRRARFIGAVLEHLGFEVVVCKDVVDGRFLRQDRVATEKNLDLIGRLMGCSRQRDMVMNDEATVSWHVEAFLRGNYGFEPDR